MEASDLRSVTIAAIFSNKQGNAIFATLVMQILPKNCPLDINCNSAYLQQQRSLKYDQPCLVAQELLSVYWCRSTGLCLPPLHYLRHHYRCQ